MSVDGGAPLVPQDHRQAGGLLQQLPHGLGLFRAGPAGAIHVDGMPQHQPFHPVLLCQKCDLFRHPVRAVGVDDGGEAGQQAGGVGDGDAGVGVAVVDGHDAHGGLLSREE